jgi:hypothetical protein
MTSDDDSISEEQYLESVKEDNEKLAEAQKARENKHKKAKEV